MWRTVSHRLTPEEISHSQERRWSRGGGQVPKSHKARLPGSYHSWLKLSLVREANWSLDRVWEGKFYEVVWKPKPARGCRKTIQWTDSRARDLLADATLCLKLLSWKDSKVQVEACFGRLFAKIVRSFCRVFSQVPINEKLMGKTPVKSQFAQQKLLATERDIAPLQEDVSVSTSFMQVSSQLTELCVIVCVL